MFFCYIFEQSNKAGAIEKEKKDPQFQLKFLKIVVLKISVKQCIRVFFLKMNNKPFISKIINYKKSEITDELWCFWFE